MTPNVEKICLSCKYFRVQNETTGRCRVMKAKTGDRKPVRPEVAVEGCCEKWQDAGQDYHIRLGWLKVRKEKSGQSK